MICQCCSKDFESRDKRRKYCSRSCAAKINGHKYPKRTSKLSYCIICSKQKPKANLCCSMACSNQYKFEQYIERWLRGEESGVTGQEGTSQYIKRYLREQCGNRCPECGWSEINPSTGRVPLQIDHINGRWDDNRPENVRMLCPNCHSLTPNYGALNKGNGRTGRYEKDPHSPAK